MPSEFHRKPRSLFEIDHFKATEFRTFLLYTGLVVLQGVLKKTLYKNFLNLQCAIYILLSSNADNLEWNSYAKSLLVAFVECIPELYCDEFLIYNVHSLIHINEDALKYGNLNNVSCFPFENYMQNIKRFVRGKKHFVQQVVNRVGEINSLGESIDRNNRVSKKVVTWNKWFVSVDRNDSCFQVNDMVVIITEIVNKKNKIRLLCKPFAEKQILKHYPCSSDKLGIYLVKNIFKQEFKCKIQDLKMKYVRLPVDSECNEFICIPLL